MISVQCWRLKALIFNSKYDLNVKILSTHMKIAEKENKLNMLRNQYLKMYWVKLVSENLQNVPVELILVTIISSLFCFLLNIQSFWIIQSLIYNCQIFFLSYTYSSTYYQYVKCKKEQNLKQPNFKLFPSLVHL